MSIAWTTTYETITPECCNAPFLVQGSVYHRWLRDKTWWHCPHCGSRRQFLGDSAEQKIKRLEQERDAARRRAEDERNSRIAVQGHLTRAKKRAAAGVCACCKRTFSNVERHMKTKHPEFMKEQA